VILHLLNGRSTEETFRQTSVPGDYFSFRDALISGPVLPDLVAEEWRRLRAAHLAQSYGVRIDECERDLLRQSEVLNSSLDHDEVVLWFEHDLFCQLNLLYLLHWFSNADLGATSLSLINIGNFPGRPHFRGLGELNSAELGSLFHERERVTNEQLELGRRAWQAFSSPEPTEIETLIETNTSSLPFLATALRAHLRRFPATTNGLGTVENKTLNLIDQGCEEFSSVFVEFSNSESVYGLGDAQLWLSLKSLANVKRPLITGLANLDNNAEIDQRFSLTEDGGAVLKGERDFLELNSIDQWLGGVHLNGREVWRWDHEADRLRYSH